MHSAEAIADAKIRLYVSGALGAGQSVALDGRQAHYLRNVMRRGTGDRVRLFNGCDGEWLAEIAELGKKNGAARTVRQLRPQYDEPDLWVVFAPIKKDGMDHIAQKGTELGAARLWPVFTQNTAVSRVNRERLLANASEAAEQCERLSVPQVTDEANLTTVLDRWPDERLLLLMDETGHGRPLAELALELSAQGNVPPVALMIGPEGGFSREEIDRFAKLPFVRRVGLGPRVLRADTAVVVALAIWQAHAGDGARPRQKVFQ